VHGSKEQQVMMFVISIGPSRADVQQVGGVRG